MTPQAKKQVYCFWCGEGLGMGTPARHNEEPDCCGSMECQRQLRSEMRPSRAGTGGRLRPILTMSSDDQILKNTIGSSGTPDLPPRSGIARKKRSDAGVPRVSAVGDIVSRFLDIPHAEQGTLLDVLEALHKRRKTKDETEAAE